MAKSKLEETVKKADSANVNLAVSVFSLATGATSLLGMIAPRFIASINNPSYTSEPIKPYEYVLLTTAVASTLTAVCSTTVYLYKSLFK